MTIQQQFADAILKARIDLGYTQSDIAEAVSISLRWYQKIESGQHLPGSITLLRLLNFLKIDVFQFKDNLGLIEPVPNITRSLLSKVVSLDSRDKQTKKDFA